MANIIAWIYTGSYHTTEKDIEAKPWAATFPETEECGAALQFQMYNIDHVWKVPAYSVVKWEGAAASHLLRGGVAICPTITKLDL
jgi:hypothetical protein